MRYADKQAGNSCLAFHPDSTHKFYCETNFLGLHTYHRTSSSVTDNDRKTHRPSSFELYQNFPNPFNSQTNIKFELPNPASVTLNIFNLFGQKVFTANQTHWQKGQHQIIWEGQTSEGTMVATGVYFYELIVHGQRSVKKTLLMR